MRTGILILILLTLSGCVSGRAYRSSLGSGAEIAIIRLNTLHGAAIIAPIYINGTLVAKFGMCEWMVVKVTPGRHVVRTEHGTSIDVVVGPRNPAFVLIDPVYGAFSANFFLKEITRSEAARYVQGCTEL